MREWHTDDRGWTEEEWAEDCMRYYGYVLEGAHRHYCNDWDDLPIDETCDEINGCTCWGTRR